MKSMGKIPVGTTSGLEEQDEEEKTECTSVPVLSPTANLKNIISWWMAYASIGNQVPGTRFIAFKVPLRDTFVDKLKPEDRFTVPLLLDSVPELGLIIDLTQTVRYYNKNEVLDRGVDYVKIPTPGQVVPAQQYVDRFFEVVDYYLDTHKNDESLIGVHCTHGVNRTGYMLCRYLIQRLGYNFEDAKTAVGQARGHPIERSPYLASLRDHRETVQKKTTRGDLEEGKSKMSKKSISKPQKKSTETRATVPGKERFARRQEHFPREDQRSRSPRRPGPGQFGDFGPNNRATMDRERMPPARGHSSPPHHIRGRSPPPQHHMRGNSPQHMRGRSPPRMQPPYMSGGPPHMRPRTPPRQGFMQGPPSHMRRTPPPQHRPQQPPPQMRGRSPPRGPPPPQHMRGRSPPGPPRGRTPPPMRGRTPPPPYHMHMDMPMGRNPTRGRTPPPGHMRDRTPPYHGRGRTPPMKGHSSPPMPREYQARRSSGGYLPPGMRWSPTRPQDGPPPPMHEPSHARRDYFPPGRRTPPPSSAHGPPSSAHGPPPMRQRTPPMRQRTPPMRPRTPPPVRREPPQEYYRAEHNNKRAPPIQDNHEYPNSNKYQTWSGGYPNEPGPSADSYTDYYGQQRRERSRSPHLRDDAPYYPEKRKEMSPPRDIKRRRKSPNTGRDKSMGSPSRYPSNGREVKPDEHRGGYPDDYWNRQPQDDGGPDCREILNERRSVRDPYPDVEYDERKRSLAERLPPKNVDLRESLEEEKRRKQGYGEPYGDYERKSVKRDYPEYEQQERDYDEHRYGGADFYSEGPPEGSNFNKFPDDMRGRRGGPGGGRGKRVFDRLARGKRGLGFRK